MSRRAPTPTDAPEQLGHVIRERDNLYAWQAEALAAIDAAGYRLTYRRHGDGDVTLTLVASERS